MRGAADVERVRSDLLLFGDPTRLGDFLAGLFCLAREQVQRQADLIRNIDTLIVSYTDEEFLNALPSLRLAFTFFTPREKHHLAKTLLQMLGLKSDVSLTALAVPAAVAAQALAFESRLFQALERYGLRTLHHEDTPSPPGDEQFPAEESASPSPPRIIEDNPKRLVRWRLVLGKDCESALGCCLSGPELQQDETLGFLYDREYGSGRNVRGKSSQDRKGSLDESNPYVPEWINQIHSLFPKKTIARLEKDALERYNLQEMVTNPEVLSRAQPNMTLLKAVLHTKHLMNQQLLAMARTLVRKVVEQLMEKLARPIQSIFLGAVDRRRRSHAKVAKNFDAETTIRRNLTHYDPESKRLFIQTPYFHSRVRRHVDRWQIIIVVDESGSMADSVIHSAVTAAIFFGLKAVRTHLVLFDTGVVDVTEHCNDPVETIMKVQLGGGTDIGNALGYAAGLIDNPRRTILILITDFFEGAPAERLFSVTKQLVESGVTFLGLAAPRRPRGAKLRPRDRPAHGEPRHSRGCHDTGRTGGMGRPKGALTMLRNDLVALTVDDLAALTNRGTVKRAEREVQEVACSIEETSDGTVKFSWSDGVVCTFPAGKVVAQGVCSCPATEMCRHLVRSVFAYQKQAAARSPAAATAPQPWNPGDLTDDQLAKHFKPAALSRLQERFGQGLLVELVRGPKPSAYFHDQPCLIRFLVPGDPRYTHCDCAESAPCSHVPLAVWAFRRLEASAPAGMIATEAQLLPIPADILDEAEAALLAWTEVGLAGASAVWKDRLTQLEKRCRTAGLVWPAEILAELRQQFERYLSHDALFQPLRVPELIGEFLIRADAIRRPTGAVPQLFIRGAASDEPLEIGSARYIGLGCDAALRKRSVELAAYFQDADSGSVVAITRDFLDPEAEEPKPLARLAETPVLKGAHFRQLGAGQVLVQGGKRNADHRLVVGRAKASVNPQNFSWEKLRAPLLSENFGEIQARLAVLPPASLRPRRVADHLYVCPVTRAEDPAFDPVGQCVLARLIDSAGEPAFLEHPFSNRGAEGTELLLQRLVAAPATVCFVAGIMHARGSVLAICPTAVVFAEDSTRSVVQPWVDRGPAELAKELASGTAPLARDDVRDYVQQLLQFLAELMLSGLCRSDALTARAAKELACLGDNLGFSRLHQPLRRLAQHLETKTRQTNWDWHAAARQFLMQTVLLRLGLDIG